jgi:hypothetical protein
MEWLVPWYSVSNQQTQIEAMERELYRELAEGHQLYGLRMRTLGRRQDCDDVLFAIEDGSERVAVVHLTWVRNPPDRLPWPDTIIYPSFEAWAIEGMRADHDEFEA